MLREEREKEEKRERTREPVTRRNAIPLDERCSNLFLFIILLCWWFSPRSEDPLITGQKLNVLSTMNDFDFHFANNSWQCRPKFPGLTRGPFPDNYCKLQIIINRSEVNYWIIWLKIRHLDARRKVEFLSGNCENDFKWIKIYYYLMKKK